METDGDAGEDVAAVAGGLDHCHGKVCQLASAPNIKVEIHLYPKPKSPIGSKIVFAVMFKNLICPRLGQQKAHAGFHAFLKTKIFNFFSVGGQCTAKKGRQIKRKGWSSW